MIIFGNTKGGTGKSTLAVHVAIALLHKGYAVSTVDLDGKQGTFSRYLENRHLFRKSIGKDLVSPRCHLQISADEELSSVRQKIEEFASSNSQDIIVIDTAGYDSPVSRYAHSLAHVLITPMNDSGIDLDLLVNIHPGALTASQLPLSQYATMVWEQRIQRASEGKGSLEWLVVRNRMHALQSRNYAHIQKILEGLSRRIGFQLAGTTGERVIFRELFSYGLTVLDQETQDPSHISARQEILNLTEKALALLKKNQGSVSAQAG
jgi:chromosome partitioning protein